MEQQMEQFIVNANEAIRNRNMHMAQKDAKKRYGHMWGKKLRAKVNKVVFPPSDFVDQTGDDVSLYRNVPEGLTAEALLSKIKEAGLVGLSGSEMPTDEKIQALIDSDAANKYLIVNGVECDPGLVHDEWLLTNRLEDIKRGAQILKDCLGLKDTFIATKLKMETRVPNRYPYGYEKLLTQRILGIEVAKEETPMQKGVLVLNVQTVLYLGEIACGRTKIDSRYITVADFTTARSKVYKVMLGTNAREIYKSAFEDSDLKSATNRLFVGHGSMLAHPYTRNDIIELGTCIIAYARAPRINSDNECKRCGKCVANCPAHIMVARIISAIDREEDIELNQFGFEKCIGCGTCTYVCPSYKNNTEVMMSLNAMLEDE